ncbi:MAG: 4-hydroxy-tetrahydrodipicolinate synthase [Bdellovibrionaceae bacterium]|nr:4-hydroxy-tetrahydrodipicolinate synthase [Pseudobdellovibrionaceae bacterium]NUM60448.1 4-hydroxy-tetrahydrodipicolinate synthase [Pseudobdellovibrionaceae bacterium]
MDKLKGVFTAIITPFENGKIDFPSLEKLIKFQVENGINGFVINGTTAESPALISTEVAEIFKKVRQWAPGLPLILGTGSNSTAKTIEDTKKAQDLGADAVLVVVPYYNKPPQRGLEAHFKAVANATTLPVILYNVPGRTITSLEPETVKNISAVKNVVGIKEATGKMDLAQKIIDIIGKNFVMLSGDDGTYVEFLGVGGHGVISVASHILPKEFVRWTALVKSGDLELARKEIKQYSKLIDLLFIEANPIPVKKALQFMNIIKSAECRLPLVELAHDPALALKEEMKKMGLL